MTAPGERAPRNADGSNAAGQNADRRRALAMAAVAVLAPAFFFAFSSPYNAVTYLPFGARLAYWSGLIFLNWLTLAAAHRHAPDRWSRWALAALAALLSTPLVLAAILTVQTAIGRPVQSHFWLQLAGMIWVINLVLAMVWTGLATPATRAATAAPEPAADSDAHRQQPLRERLPEGARQEPILALAAQDHYVTVHLPSGNHLIHMRFGDAVHMLGAIEGLQVHRSWWVAREGVSAIERKSGKWRIELVTGDAAPVSRAGAARLKDAGWR